jgi:hypothetical protein
VVHIKYWITLDWIGLDLLTWNQIILIVFLIVGLSKYDYNTISVVIYCNCIVSSNPAIVCIGSVFIAYHIQFIFIINHINQPYYRLWMSLR